MKVVKKIGLFIIIFMCGMLITGCGNVEGSLEDIMATIYADIPEEEVPTMLMNTEINDENIEYYLGTKDIEYTEALASESSVDSVAHSVVLVRTKENANIDEIKDKISESANPKKWDSVEVEEDDVIVENVGDLIILIMVDDEDSREKIEESFEALN